MNVVERAFVESENNGKCHEADCLFDEISSGLHQVCKILIYKHETSRMTDTHSIIFLAKIYADLERKIDVIQLSLSSVN